MNSPRRSRRSPRSGSTCAKAAGPTSWTTYEYPNCTGDLGDGTAMMVYDADSATYPKNKPGASQEAGNLAWHPGPAGPDGSYATNLWTWSLAMNSSFEEQACRLAVHPVGHRQGGHGQGRSEAAFADPTRKSVFDGAFKQTLGEFPGLPGDLRKGRSTARRSSSPRRQKFFETTEDWAVALQDIYAGDDAKSRLTQPRQVQHRQDQLS